jgi:hypothetical protein
MEELDTLLTNFHIPSRRIMMMKKPTIRKTIKGIKTNTRRNVIRKWKNSTPKKT